MKNKTGPKRGKIAPTPAELLEAIKSKVLEIEISINIGADYAEHVTALPSLVEQARDGGCDEQEITSARRGF